MNRSFNLRPLCVAVALLVGSVNVAAISASESGMAPSNKDSQALYWQGHEQLKQGRWEQAIKRFVELEQRLRRDEPGSVDAALYWQAYAQSKAKRSGEAKATVERLQREFPGSRWREEAQQLLSGGPALRAGSASSEQEDLASIAIDGLMAAPPERAVPLLRKVLDGNYSSSTKRRALFVLSQLDGDAASEALLGLARNGDSELRMEAINMLGISGSPAAMQALQEFYASSQELEIRRHVLHAWMVAEYKDGVLKAAASDADPELRREAVHLLGAMGAHAELNTLLAQSTQPDVQEAVVEALGIAGDADGLAALVGGQHTVELQVQALQALGVAGEGQRLAELYPRLQQPKLREAALNGLMISGESDQLLALYRSASNSEDKRAILRMLTVMGDDSALQAIESVLQEGDSK